MAERNQAELYLKPHIVKYLYVKLHQELRHHTPNGATIWRELLRELEPSLMLTEAQPTDRHARAHGRLRIEVRLSADGDLSESTNNRMAWLAEQEYYREMCRFADNHYYGGLSNTKNGALQAFRALYGITEDDQSLRTCERYYARYERRNKRHLQRGGARPNSGPAPKRPRPMRAGRGPRVV